MLEAGAEDRGRWMVNRLGLDWAGMVLIGSVPFKADRERSHWPVLSIAIGLERGLARANGPNPGIQDAEVTVGQYPVGDKDC